MSDSSKSGQPEPQYPPPGSLEYRQRMMEYYNHMPDEDEIDLVELFGKIWKERKLVFKMIGVFVFLGLLVALGSSEEFTSEVKLMPETQQGMGLGSLGSLARQFGVGSAPELTESIPAELYPDITQSLVLMSRLKDYEVVIPETDEPVTLFEYFNEYRTQSLIGLPFTLAGTVKNWLKGAPELPADRIFGDEAKRNRILRMSSEEWEVIRMLQERVTTGMDRETGAVTVSVKMPDAEMAADVADQVVEFLTEYITSYRTEKARKDVEFIEERHREARSRFEAAQEQIARFRDENRGELTALARTREQRLESEYNLTFNLYNTMEERLEEARIKLQDDTPVVNILQPAAVPDEKSEPKRTLIMIISIFLGGITGIGLIFIKKQWTQIRLQVQEQGKE